jgi:hypothetical protein
MMKNNKLLYEAPRTDILEICVEGVVCQSNFDRPDYGDVIPFAPAYPEENLF